MTRTTAEAIRDAYNARRAAGDTTPMTAMEYIASETIAFGFYREEEAE